MTLKLIKENEKGKTFQADGFKILYRYKDTIAGDNAINIHELIYLVSGEIELTIKEKTKTYTAPAEFEIPEKTHHKIKSLTDTTMLLFEK